MTGPGQDGGLPDGALHHAAALLEGIERDDPDVDLAALRDATEGAHWEMCTVLAGACLRLAHHLFGPGVTSWIEALRTQR